MNNRSKEGDNGQPSDFLIQKRERKQSLIDEATILGEQLDSSIVGVCGHRTGSGAREYPVYRENETAEHFVVFGLKDQLLIAENMQDYEQIRQRAIDEGKNIVFQPVAEKGGYIIKPIDPENVFGRKMQTIEEWESN